MDLQVTAAIVAVTEAIKRLLPEQVKGIVTIVVALALGVAWAAYNGTDLVAGGITGLVASGVISVAKTVSNK